MENKSFNIAIDGPAGAGKSTIAKMVAKELNFIYVDTGAMFRAIALYMLNHNIDKDDSKKISENCGDVSIRIEYQDGVQQVLLNDENVSEAIRQEKVGNMASAVAKNTDVRAKLLDLQRNMAAVENVVMDGRDIGTCVLPDAQVKIYLTASSKVRAQRRYNELVEKGVDCNLDEIENDIIARDEQDMNREVAPLKQAEDAILIDSSDMKTEEVRDAIITIFRERCK